MYSLRLACEPGPNQQDQQLIAYVTLVSHSIFPLPLSHPKKQHWWLFIILALDSWAILYLFHVLRNERLSEAFSFSNHHHLKEHAFLFFLGQGTNPPLLCSLNGPLLWLNLLPFVMKLNLLDKSTLFSDLKQLRHCQLKKNFK